MGRNRGDIEILSIRKINKINVRKLKFQKARALPKVVFVIVRDSTGLRLVFASVRISRLYRGMCVCILILTCAHIYEYKWTCICTSRELGQGIAHVYHA